MVVECCGCFSLKSHVAFAVRSLVSNIFDRKCLLAILEKYVTPKILETDYRFSESGTYRHNTRGDHEELSGPQ